MNETPHPGAAPLTVARIQNAIHNISPDLRLDAANGFHKLVWITKGNGRLMHNGVTQGFGPHSLIFIAAEEPHAISLGQNTSGIAIALSPDSGVQLPPHSLCHSVDGLTEQSRFTHHFDTILQEYLSDEIGAGRAVLSYLSLLCVQILRTTALPDQSSKPKAAQRLMERFSEMVEAEFFKDTSISKIAADLDVTPTHLTRVCQAQNGISASQFLQNRILSEARHQLLFSSDKIQDISDGLGFTSPAYFSRLFTEKTGVNPKSFRSSRKEKRRNAPKPRQFSPLRCAS